ncbi:hypothetical protein AB0J43_22455 [Nonomuraea fuscirosea]
MTDLLTDPPAPTPADLIHDAIDLMRTTWRVRGDYVIGSMLKERYHIREPGYSFCPVGAICAVAGDVFIAGVPQCRVPVVQDTLRWLVTFYRLPRSRPEAEAGRDDRRMTYLRVVKWADSFTEAQDDELYAALEAAADAWRPALYPVGGTANPLKRRSR